MAEKIRIRLVVNDQTHDVETYPMARLLDVLRESLHVTGPKEGCGEGECGACAVLVNGDLVNSCLIPALQADEASITTIEGIAAAGQLDRIQNAFLGHGGAQCGICTPGMILAAVHLLRSNPAPSEEEIRTALAGNLCRCTGYTGIIQAVKSAAAASAGKNRNCSGAL